MTEFPICFPQVYFFTKFLCKLRNIVVEIFSILANIYLFSTSEKIAETNIHKCFYQIQKHLLFPKYDVFDGNAVYPFAHMDIQEGGGAKGQFALDS